MRDRRNGPFDNIIKILLYVVSLVYAFFIRIWEMCYSLGIFKTHKVPLKVVSVGNITVGGTGKTPLVRFMARRLIEKGKRISILIRGYGDDEWRMLKETVLSVPILVGRDRIKTARQAEKLHKPDILLLDDGYQHRRLGRDLNILLIDAADPFGNGHMLPRGILREPLRSIKQADVVVLTKADFGRDNVPVLREMLARRFNKHKILEAKYKPVCFTDIVSRKRYSPDFIRGKKLSVLSGIADPRYFKRILKELGGVLIREFDYRDHSTYTEGDLSSIESKSKESGSEFIITTEKDAVKLNKLNIKNALRILILHVEVEITKDMEELVDTISGLNSSNSR